MDEAIDAAATIGTGALLAREAERTHAPGHDRSDRCANCGTALNGPYCSTCGQHGHVHRTVGALFHDLLHGVLHFDGKFWATLPLLAWRPGELTRRYIHGERAKFVSPVALFLFSVFLLFAVMSNLPGKGFGQGMIDGLTDSGSGKVRGARARLLEQSQNATAAVVAAERSLAAERMTQPPRPAQVAQSQARLETARAEQREVQLALGLMPGKDTAETAAATKTKQNWLFRRYQAAKQDPKLLLYKIKTSAYKWSWALIPLSLPFIWLLFPMRRSVGMYDHAIFATYSLSFMSLLMVVLGLLNWIGVPAAPLILVALIVPIVHIYRQLRGAYQLSRLGAIWRAWLMLWFISLIVPLFAMLLLYLGVAD
ncbi:DUF3667 domain-containing protein [Sphingomonas sp.]|uniref:DUF3667 domain-containing protein n=1 Tax=Sphingomonas sp. TaxID=28214 RepID=UPI002D80108F|nr:DUF3667 domain-containing protein [Sphingomonas sp.]HEU0043894.1 DUF3667 domain-containing protein [Sphingomonas sp.]